MEQIRWCCTCQHYWNPLVLFASGHQLLLRALTDERVSTWQEAAPQLLLPITREALPACTNFLYVVFLSAHNSA